jgi:hypothetical protein
MEVRRTTLAARAETSTIDRKINKVPMPTWASPPLKKIFIPLSLNRRGIKVYFSKIEKREGKS